MYVTGGSLPAAASLKNWPVPETGSPNRRIRPVPSVGPVSIWNGPVAASSAATGYEP